MRAPPAGFRCSVARPHGPTASRQCRGLQQGASRAGARAALRGSIRSDAANCRADGTRSPPGSRGVPDRGVARRARRASAGRNVRHPGRVPWIVARRRRRGRAHLGGVRAIDAEGLVPVLAHPERCPAVAADPASAVRFAERGWPLCLNGPSVLGDHGQTAERIAWWLLGEGTVSLVASDAHGAGRLGSRRHPRDDREDSAPTWPTRCSTAAPCDSTTTHIWLEAPPRARGVARRGWSRTPMPSRVCSPAEGRRLVAWRRSAKASGTGLQRIPGSRSWSTHTSCPRRACSSTRSRLMTAGVVRGARAADRRPPHEPPPLPLERVLRQPLRRDGSLRAAGPPRPRRRGVEPIEFGDEVCQGVVAHEMGAICPDGPRSTARPPCARARGRGGSLGAGWAAHLRARPPDGRSRADESGLRTSYRRLAELDFDHLLLAHGAPFVGAGRRRSPPSRRDAAERDCSCRSWMR